MMIDKYSAVAEIGGWPNSTNILLSYTAFIYPAAGAIITHYAPLYRLRPQN